METILDFFVLSVLALALFGVLYLDRLLFQFFFKSEGNFIHLHWLVYVVIFISLFFDS